MTMDVCAKQMEPLMEILKGSGDAARQNVAIAYEPV
jgi:triosephosphate isomerase